MIRPQIAMSWFLAVLFFAIAHGASVKVYLDPACSTTALYTQGMSNGTCCQIAYSNKLYGVNLKFDAEILCNSANTNSKWSFAANTTSCTGTKFPGSGSACSSITVNGTTFYYKVDCGASGSCTAAESVDYTSPGFITLWAILGLIAIGGLIIAIAYTLTAQKRRQSVPDQNSSASEIPLN